MAEKITVLVTASILGPRGEKLVPNRIHTFDDSPYLRIMLKSGSIELIDPPHLDYIDNPKKEAPKKEAPVKEEVKEEVASDGASDIGPGSDSEATGGSDNSKGSRKKSGDSAEKSTDSSPEGLGGLQSVPLRF